LTFDKFFVPLYKLRNRIPAGTCLPAPNRTSLKKGIAMKKIVTYGITLVFLVIFSVTACSQNADVREFGVTSAASVMTLLPADIQGIFMMDVNRVMMTKFAIKTINEKDNYPKYRDFVSETGLDPQKDIYWAAIALTGLPEKNHQEGAAVISMTYDRDRLLAALKKEHPGMSEITYNGVTVHTGMTGRGSKPGSAAFLDETRAVFGSETMVKAVIDVYKKNQDNVFTNKTLSGFIDKADQNAMVWSAIAVSPDDMKAAASQNSMMDHFQDFHAMTMFFDYRNLTFDMEVRFWGGDQDKNRQLADILTGFKALGASAAAENPDIGDLLNSFDVLAGPDFVTIQAKLPEDLMHRVSRSVSEKAADMQ